MAFNQTSTENPTTPPKMAGSIPRFTVGQEYARRDEIHLNYGGGRQSGVSTSAACPAIFLFTGETGEQYGYHDGFDDAGVFSYSGEGQLGDMRFVVGNKAVRDHAQDGRALHLFESLGKGKRHRYLGEFVLANHSIRRGPDRNGSERDIIVFHLVPVKSGLDFEPSDDRIVAEPVSIEEARQRAVAACTGLPGGAGNVAVRTLYERSERVRSYVLMRARGACECCGNAAPFVRADGSPFLEVHHTTRLSDGGLDHPMHTAAVCPNCHREIHSGQQGVEKNGALRGKLATSW